MSFTSDVKIQRGSVVYGASADSTTVTITTVGSLTKAFARITGVAYASGGPDAGTSTARVNADLGCTCRLTDTSTITFARNAAGANEDVRIYWEVWEYVGPSGGPNEFIVHLHEAVGLTDGVTTNNSSTFTPTDANDCIAILCGISCGQTTRTWSNVSVRAEVAAPSPPTITVTRGGNTGSTTVVIAAVEFKGSNWTVRRNINHTFTAAGADETEAITAIASWDEAFVFAGMKMASANDGVDEVGFSVRPGSTTSTVRFRLQSGHSSPTGVTVTAHVVHHPDLKVDHRDSITGGETDLPAGTDASQTENYTVDTQANTATSAAIGFTIATGTGTLYPRPHWNYRLTSTTNVEFWRARGGTSSGDDFSLQVIDFSEVGFRTSTETLGGLTESAKAPARSSEALGSVADTSAHKAAAPGSESLGAVSDSSSLRAALPGAESLGGVSDSASLKAALPATESLAAATDTASLKAVLTGSEALGAGSESSALRLAGSEILAAITETTAHKAALPGSEALSGIADAAAHKAALPGSEVLAAITDVAAHKAALPGSEILATITDAAAHKAVAQGSETLSAVSDTSTHRAALPGSEILGAVPETAAHKAAAPGSEVLGAAADSATLRLAASESLGGLADSGKLVFASSESLGSVAETSSHKAVAAGSEVLGTLVESAATKQSFSATESGFRDVRESGSVRARHAKSEVLGVLSESAAVDQNKVNLAASEALGSLTEYVVPPPPPLPQQAATGSRIITPLIPQLVHSWHRPIGASAPPVGSTAELMEMWHYNVPGEEFRAFGNCDRLTTWTPSVGPATMVRPMHGWWDRTTYPGPAWAAWGGKSTHNLWAWHFLRRFHPTHLDWHNDAEFYNGGNKVVGQTGGGGGRAYVWRPLYWAIANPVMAGQPRGAESYEWMIQWNQVTHDKRLRYHLWRGTTGAVPDYSSSGPLHPPFPELGSFDINDDPSNLGGTPRGPTERSWNALATWSESDPAWLGTEDPAYDGWNSWDRGHHYHVPWAALAMYGHPLGAVNVWDDWRWVCQAYPGTITAQHMDQPRSTANILMITVHSWLAGIEYADPNLFVEQCGGIYGRNGGAGWRPSDLLPVYVAGAIGARFSGGFDIAGSGDPSNPYPYLDASLRCGQAAGMGCVNDPNYPNQVADHLTWQAVWELWSLVFVREFRNWMLSIYGVEVFTKAPITPSNPTGSPTVLAAGLDAGIAHLLDYVKFTGWVKGTYGIFTTPNEWTESYMVDQVVMPPTQILPTQNRGWDFTYAAALNEDPDLVGIREVLLLPNSRYTIVAQGASVTAQWLGPASYAWYYGIDDADVAAMMGHPKWPTLANGQLIGEKVNLAGPAYAAGEALGDLPGIEAQIFGTEALGAPSGSAKIVLRRSETLAALSDSAKILQKRTETLGGISESAKVRVASTEALGAVSEAATIRLRSMEALAALVDSSRQQVKASQLLGSITDAADQRAALSGAEALGAVLDLGSVPGNFSVAEIFGAIQDVASLGQLGLSPTETLGALSDSAQLTVRVPATESLGTLGDTALLRAAIPGAELLGALADAGLLSDAEFFAAEALGILVDSGIRTAPTVFAEETLGALQDSAQLRAQVFAQEVLFPVSEAAGRGDTFAALELLGALADSATRDTFFDGGSGGKPQLWKLFDTPVVTGTLKGTPTIAGDLVSSNVKVN